LQEARDRAGSLEAQCARLTAAIEEQQLERSYLVAERQLVGTHVRRLALMLRSYGAQGLSGNGGSSTSAVDAYDELADEECRDPAEVSAAAATRAHPRPAEAHAAEAWARLPASSLLRGLGGPLDGWRDVRALGREAARALSAQKRDLSEADRRASEAEARVRSFEARYERLAGRLKAVAKAAAAQAAQAEVGGREAARAREAVRQREAALQRRLDEMVGGATWAVIARVSQQHGRHHIMGNSHNSTETAVQPG
jgi:hypothetical protein